MINQLNKSIFEGFESSNEEPVTLLLPAINQRIENPLYRVVERIMVKG